MWIKEIVRKLLYKEQSSSQEYISYMQSKGTKIVKRVTIFRRKQQV